MRLPPLLAGDKGRERATGMVSGTTAAVAVADGDGDTERALTDGTGVGCYPITERNARQSPVRGDETMNYPVSTFCTDCRAWISILVVG